jgi:hypothetical protein
VSAASGYSGTPLARKLGIREGSRVCLRAAPADYPQRVAPLPPGVQLTRRLSPRADIIHVFATRRARLEAQLRAALALMRADAALWVSWPKKASGRPTDITEGVVRELALPLDLVDIKVCAVDEVWSGLKLVIRRSARPGRARPG